MCIWDKMKWFRTGGLSEFFTGESAVNSKLGKNKMEGDE